MAGRSERGAESKIWTWEEGRDYWARKFNCHGGSTKITDLSDETQHDTKLRLARWRPVHSAGLHMSPISSFGPGSVRDPDSAANHYRGWGRSGEQTTVVPALSMSLHMDKLPLSMTKPTFWDSAQNRLRPGHLSDFQECPWRSMTVSNYAFSLNSAIIALTFVIIILYMKIWCYSVISSNVTRMSQKQNIFVTRDMIRIWTNTFSTW